MNATTDIKNATTTTRSAAEEDLEECCEKCYLIECCCEADRLQVIKDDERATADGYVENGDGRWVKKNEEEVEEWEEDTDEEDFDDFGDTVIRGIVCNRCGLTLEDHTVMEHLDITCSIHRCEGGHKKTNPTSTTR